MARITALNIYPIKGCRGLALSSARVTEAGFEHDREWLIVRPDGRFLTQREEPRLALIEPVLDECNLEVRLPNGASVRMPLDAEGPQVAVTCWRDVCAAFDMGEEVARLLSDFLEHPVRLVRFDARRRRLSDPSWTQGVEATTRFADAFAWLLTCEASLEDLSSRLDEPVPMNRFRPNIVLGGVEPFYEDGIHELYTQDVRLRAVKPCGRCIVPTTDQQTGQRTGVEPLRTLRSYRYDSRVKGATFGQNLILISGAGNTLSVGQQLQATRKS
ncbi:MAG TPA: MOSC N-terminal beta barrel domain-containing protein [Steroidobacteraceae bacterium]